MFCMSQFSREFFSILRDALQDIWEKSQFGCKKGMRRHDPLGGHVPDSLKYSGDNLVLFWLSLQFFPQSRDGNGFSQF